MVCRAALPWPCGRSLLWTSGGSGFLFCQQRMSLRTFVGVFLQDKPPEGEVLGRRTRPLPILNRERIPFWKRDSSVLARAGHEDAGPTLPVWLACVVLAGLGSCLWRSLHTQPLSFCALMYPVPRSSCDLANSTNPFVQGAPGTQLVERPTSAQVMISQFVGSSPESGSVLRAWRLAWDSVSPSLSPPPLLVLCLSQK